MFSDRKLVSAAPTATLDHRLQILLVEDHLVLREALVALLNTTDEVVVSATASSAEEALPKVHDDFDVVILDLSLPGRDGIWLAQEIKAAHPRLPILVLTMHEEPTFVLKALEAGVDGYLTKWAGENELLKAIHSVARNGSYLQARIAPLVVDAIRNRDTVRKIEFSEREHEIARYLVNGLSNSEIAGQISLSVSTVKSSLRSLYSKLHVSSRSEAVAVVVEKGIACRG